MEVKLFTMGGLLVTAIHDLIIMGGFAGWMWFQVSVMGNDVNIGGDHRASQSSRK